MLLAPKFVNDKHQNVIKKNHHLLKFDGTCATMYVCVVPCKAECGTKRLVSGEEWRKCSLTQSGSQRSHGNPRYLVIKQSEEVMMA